MIQTLIEYPNGGKVKAYRMIDQTTDDFQKIYASCDYFAKQGAKVLITPGFLTNTIGNPLYELIYASLKGTAYWGTCPDFNVDGVWYEHEGYDTSKDLSNPKKRSKTFSKMIGRGVKQSDRLIVEDCEVGRFYAKRNIYSRIHFENQTITEVYIRTADGLELLYKKGEG